MAQSARFRYRSPVGLIAIRTRSSATMSGTVLATEDAIYRQSTGSHGDSSGTRCSGPRLGITVTKKVGSSPVRNRWKRIIRESFRLGPAVWDDARGLDLVVIIRPGCDFVPVAGVTEFFRSALARWHRKSGVS